MNDKMISKYIEWFKKGDHDYDYAKSGLDSGNTPDVACILCQQCIEKYLKGLLIWKGVLPPRVHDLSALLDLIEDSDFDEYRDQLNKVSSYYLQIRYPVDLSNIDCNKKDAQDALNLVEKIRKLVLAKIG